MQIIVCVKAVPDTATRIKVHASGQKIDQEGVKYALGPYDARARAKAIELGVACVTDAVALEAHGDKCVVTRAAESRTETIEVKLPACVTAQRDLAEEKYPKLKDILGAGKKPIETFAFPWPAPAWELKKLSA